jgi:putative PEP-CTERM system TPR-repeat lipoprotein
MEMARRIQQQHPESYQGYLVEGDLHLAAKEYEQAARSYTAGYDRQKTAELAVKLFQARLQGGDEGSARMPLEDWIVQHPEDLRVRQVLAQAYLRADKSDAAIEQYQVVVEQQPDNVAALNNLAWMYHTQKDARAVDHAQRAYDLAPDKPEVADTLGWLLLDRGELERGLALLQEAAGRAPHIPAIRYHRAVALAKNDRSEEARKELERLLRDHSDFAEADDARSLLTQLTGQQ